MIAAATWPTGTNVAAGAHASNADGPPGQPPEDHEPAHVVIAQMADLVRDTGLNTVADACILSTVLIGAALEALSARVLRPGLVGLLNIGMLCCVLACWLAAVVMLAWAGRPVLIRVGQLRWVTGAPLDPRPGWVTLPPTGASTADWTWDRAYLLLGAARMARYRMQFADTWTYVAGGCFLVCSALVILGL